VRRRERFGLERSQASLKPHLKLKASLFNLRVS
jgi:hypothetical protein